MNTVQILVRAFKQNRNGDIQWIIVHLIHFFQKNKHVNEICNLLTCLKMFHDGIISIDTKDFKSLFQVSTIFISEMTKYFETGIDSNSVLIIPTQKDIVLTPDEMCLMIIHKIHECENEKGVLIPKEISIDDLKDYNTFVFYILYYTLLKKL
jgi:hypothetical protein